MEKTVKEWLQELPDGYRERALKNLMPENAGEKSPSLYESLLIAFRWASSIEGFFFWLKVHVHVNNPKKPLPPLPDEPKQKTQKYSLEQWRKQARAFREKASYWREKAEKLDLLVESLKINEGILESANADLRDEIATLTREKEDQLHRHQTDFIRVSSERNRLETQVKDIAESLSKTTNRLDEVTVLFRGIHKENDQLETQLMEAKSSLGFFKILTFFLVIAFLIFCAIFLPN